MLDFVLALGLVANSWFIPNRTSLTAGQIVKSQMLSRLVEGILKLGLASILARSFGLTGIAASSSIAALRSPAKGLPSRSD